MQSNSVDTLQWASESVKAVAFGFMTDADIRKHSVVKINKAILLDNIDKPVPGGLYDPAMGPLDDEAACKSCAQRSFYCPGHFGHIDLVSPVYNPLLFNILYTLLQRTCFFCHHFRASREQVEKCITQLKLIAKGDVVGAKMLDSDLSIELNPERSNGGHSLGPEHMRKGEWTSLQYTEAMSVLNNFLKPKHKGCKNCEAKNPKISKPTFGWLDMHGMSGAVNRANVIRDCKLRDEYTSGADGKSSLEEENTLPWGDDVSAEDTVINSPTRKFGELPAEFIKQSNYFSGPLLPSEVKDIIKLLWENEAQLCSFISDIQCQGYGKEVGHSMFFLQSILVPPIKFRPPSKGGDQVMENSQTVQLTKVLQSNISLGNAHINNSKHSDIVYRWRELQQSINMLFDSKTATGQQKDVGVGICQLLDKKEGLFRQKMMGKRVNFACRSVISPDPYLAVNEIGIPPYFASRLTYPERATPWNVSKLRHAIINGPDTHPGATHYIDKSITMKLIPNRKSRITISRKLPSSRGLFQDHGMGSEYEFEGKTVNRHLQDGDIVLVNRQPTLHKPSIMAHVVRVLKGEKTIRMHYANCSTYNADFDGDEMNVHFPQDEISRAEAYNIVNANNQYVKPTSGEPIRALIQDHIISAVLLTKKDTFLSREEFNQLLFSTGVSAAATNSSSGKSLRKVFTLNSGDEVEPPLPAIWKPEPLWTGKQVITALLNYITRGFNPFTVEKDAKIRRGFFKSRSGKDQAKDREGSVIEKLKEYPDEDNLMIYKNDLVRGVIDKAQFGDYGLVHTVHELYGSNTAGLLLSVLSRLFTVYLQMHGFTCGVDDLLLMKSNDMEREKQLKICEDIGEKVHREFLKLKDDEELDPMALQYNIEKTIRDNGESALTSLDRRMTSQLNERTGNSVVLKDLLSVGLLKPSFYNCISLMTTSGAKGGTANFQQISSHLGQQQLEGKRVPRMVSGKTLPCFLPWDWASRAGGFIVDRFLTGLHPQEYYFHCMAGREGLVDTAVKTSRSGYLQRCLIKNLESLKVCYDYTVRDSDGSIVQFRYGEDGIDVHRTAFIEKFDALAANQETIYKNSHHQLDKSSPYIQELLSSLRKNVRSKDYSSFNQKTQKLLKQDKFFKLLEHKYLSSLAQPGEPVGVLAAQSIGEPSTQMTLNTFHHAGRGEMNVTLGIPRLQEILMTASRDIQTPIMTCPLREGYSMDEAKHLADKLKKVTIADIIEIMKVTVVPFSVVDKDICSIYKLEMKLYPLEDNPKHSHVSTDDLEETLGTLFVRALEDAIQNEMLLLSRINGIKFFMPESQSQASNETDEDISSSKSQPEGNKNEDDDDDGRNDNEDGGGAEDLDFDSKKQKLQGTDEMDYEDDGDDEESNPLETSENESEVDQADNKVENANDKVENANNEAENTDIEVDHISKKTKKSKVEGKKKKVKGERVIKEFDRAIFVKAKGEHFEAHFKFPNDPHILLTQLAQKTAKRVYIQSSGKVDQCQQITCKESQVIYHGHDNPKARKEMKPDEKEKIPALQTTGIDFTTMWDLQDELDVRCIYSNNIHAMLVNYGVEAARETIIREVRNIFNSYGISVNFRHLSLIADFMTHTGGYRAMSRLGGIAEFISPLSKMCFETASKFIVEAAYHGEVDDLETPSARICLGLPVKMGTGSFDLMQKLQG